MKIQDTTQDRIQDNIHERIKKRRLELGLTLKDVAEALHVSESTLSRYESAAIQNIGIDKVEPLAIVLRCSPGYIMGWSDSKYGKETEVIYVVLENDDLRPQLIHYANFLVSGHNANGASTDLSGETPI